MSTRKLKIWSIIIAVIIVIVLLIIIIHFAHKKNNSVPPVALKTVALSAVEIQDIPRTTSTMGTMIPEDQTDISAKVAGYVEKIFFKEGDFVKADQALIQLNDEQERNDVAAAQADMHRSELQYQRDQDAYKKGLVLQDKVYSDKVDYEKNKALLQTKETTLSDMKITAPFSGKIAAKAISIGDYISPGKKLTTLVSQSPLKVKYNLPARYISQLKLNQVVSLNLPNSDKTFTAKVTYIAPLIDSESQTVEVHAVLHTSDDELKSGAFVTVHQSLGIQPQAMLVPEDSVSSTISGDSVFMVNNGKAISVPVHLGEHLYGKVEVLSGLKKEDKIITAGQRRLHEGDSVTIAPPTNPPS